MRRLAKHGEAPAAGAVTGLARIEETFARCAREGRAALVTYVMAGDPDLATSREMALACVRGGADLLELGVPFSDPIADGPTIQRAAERALASGTRLSDCLALAEALSARTQVPLVLMGYVNPVLAFGPGRFFAACRRAGVAGVILPDVPPEESTELAALAREAGVALIFLLAPTSTGARTSAALEVASGFLYFVSVTGVTGARTALPRDLAAQVERVRERSPVPVVVGFGVSTPAHASRLAGLADGVVVGSAIVSRIAEGGSRAARAARVTAFVSGLSAATRRKGSRPPNPR